MCLITYGIAGLDPVASAWVGSLHHARGFLGMLQGCFSIGSAVSPLIVNAMVQRGIPYYQFYHVPFALSMLGGIGFTFSFWSEDGEKYARDTRSSHNSSVDHTKEILKNKVFSSGYSLRISLLTEQGLLDSSAIRAGQLGC
ncbi:hypothetical protein HOY82DRAFT_491584 [Tuber indicum]|nr:hypothetical protein HOY82DRAFT_491584 [Tuber indicum]